MRRARLHAADGSVARMLDLAPPPVPAPRVVLVGDRCFVTSEAQTDPARVMVYLEVEPWRVA